MNTIVRVKDIIGADFTCQDAIILRKYVKENLDSMVTLDFEGIEKVPTTFFYTLLSDLIYENGRQYVFDHIVVKNLSNINDYRMVLLGVPA